MKIYCELCGKRKFHHNLVLVGYDIYNERYDSIRNKKVLCQRCLVFFIITGEMRAPSSEELESILGAEACAFAIAEFLSKHKSSTYKLNDLSFSTKLFVEAQKERFWRWGIR